MKRVFREQLNWPKNSELQVIRQMIKEFPGPVISISHDRKFVDEVCDTVYELKEEGLCKIE